MTVKPSRLLRGWIKVLDPLFKLFDHSLPRQLVLLGLIRVVTDEIALAINRRLFHKVRVKKRSMRE